MWWLDCNLLILVVFAFHQTSVDGSHTIITPKRWTVGTSSQICVALTQPATEQDQIEASIKDGDKLYSQLKTFTLTPGETDSCFALLIDELVPVSNAQLTIRGQIDGKPLNYTKSVTIQRDNVKVFVQTDKYLYKPGQNVQFRILTLKGPYLEVLNNNYDEIWIENPSGSRIAQWLDVDNTKSLVHLSFQLSEEPEEGKYTINVKSGKLKTTKTPFKVEEYVLPRYEVTVTTPSYVLGTSESVIFNVCAKYTFGQPVKGSVVLEIDNGGWGEYLASLEKKSNISGCVDFKILTQEVKIYTSQYHSHALSAKATVTEDGTGVVLVSDKVKVDVSRVGINFENLSLQKFHKPGVPFLGEVKASLPDGTPAVNEPVEVCLKACKTFTTSNNGIVKFAVPPHFQTSIKVKAVNFPGIRADNSWRSIMYASEITISMKKYHSSSNSSIVIASSSDELECLPGKSIDFELPVRFSTTGQGITKVHVQVISRGQIQFTSATDQDLSVENDLHIPPELFVAEMNPSSGKSVRGSFVIPISLPNTVSPKASILVWFATKDGEVVSDQRDVDITKCLRNSVTMTWSTPVGQPGESVDLTLEAAPSSLCSLGVVDKSVELLSSSHKSLTLDKIFEVAELSSVSQYEHKQVDDYEYCKDKFLPSDPVDDPVPMPLPGPPGPVEEELPIRRKRSFFNPYYSDDIDALHMFDEAGVYVLSDLKLESRPCNRNFGNWDRTIMYSPALAGVPGNPQRRTQVNAVSFDDSSTDRSSSKTDTRTYFPETWLWDIIPVQDGNTVLPLTLPDTVTEWIGQTVCVHPSQGIGLSEPKSVTTFKDFFVDLTLPATVKRGEIFPVKISVFNYLKEQLPVRVELLPSSEYEIFEDKGEVLGSGERTGCVDPEDKTVYSIRIRPKALGDVNITIDSMVDMNSLQCGTGSNKERRDILIKPIKVELEGFPKEKTFTKYICGSDIEDGTDSVTPWNMTAPSRIVEDSARAWVSVAGDLMGPTIENLGGLVKMPYGCGEQNMLNFAPNIYVMQYLSASNQTTDEIAIKSIEFMKKGYQRELTYRHSDGSYSAFGSSDDSGSTWLTAFVLRCFFQAREFISIDSTDLQISQDWLRRKQLENGCFESVGRVLHKGMKGGLSNSDSPSLLSAFVLISLLESGEDPSSIPVREALFCLQADSTKDPYASAVKAYALALSRSPDAQESVVNLMNLSTKTQSAIHWEFADSEKKSQSVGVETAAYAVLALLAVDAQSYKPELRLIVKWMNNQRNGQGGFVSTQDTIVALQAMAAYERMLPSPDIDSTVMYSSSDDTFRTSFTVNENNKFLLQKDKVEPLPAVITGDIVGMGCILLQGVLRYNIPEAEQSVAFKLSVNTSTPTDANCKTKNIKVCASYVLPDKASNMAIIEVKLISGYVPVKEDLKRVVGYGTGFFKRYEVDGSTISFYVDEFTSESLCASFNIIREVDVENPKPGTVKVYDYYKPEYAVSEKYVLPDPTECVTTVPELPFESEIIQKTPDAEIDYEAMEGLISSLDDLP